MPNHVKNIIKMKGITALPLFTSKGEFDFNMVIPMPQSLGMKSGSIENLAIEAALRNDAVLRHEYVFKLNMPPPSMSEQEYQTRIANYNQSVDHLCAIGRQYISNLRLYGATTWYGWCNKNWDTKWNAYQSEQYDSDTIAFLTAWSAPKKVIAQLARMYPNAEIEHWWADEDTGYNSGYTKYTGGQAVTELLFDNCSSEAYETYVFCWGESDCLYQTQAGEWQHRNCEQCQRC